MIVYFVDILLNKIRRRTRYKKIPYFNRQRHRLLIAKS
jgi:hypothetical protein